MLARHCEALERLQPVKCTQAEQTESAAHARDRQRVFSTRCSVSVRVVQLLVSDQLFETLFQNEDPEVR